MALYSAAIRHLATVDELGEKVSDQQGLKGRKKGGLRGRMEGTTSNYYCRGGRPISGGETNSVI